MSIHPTALVASDVYIGSQVEVGPYSIIDSGVTLEAGCKIGAFCHLYGGTHLGKNVHIFDNAQVGGQPQDLKFKGESAQTLIGAGTQIREFVTIHRGTSCSGKTVIGANCLLMALVHVAHDCVIGDSCQIANAVQLAGHVWIGANTVIGGMTGVHQFSHIGSGSYVAGGVRVTRDILPYTRALGEPLVYAGFNTQAVEKIFPGETNKKIQNILQQHFRHLRLVKIPERDTWIEQGRNLELVGPAFEDFFSRQNRPILWPVG